MEELATVGFAYHPGLAMPLWHNPQEDFSGERGAGSRLRLILLQKGTVILCLQGRREIFIAPTLFCFNEKEAPLLEQAMEAAAQALYFHPAIINGVFDYDNIRSNAIDSSTDYTGFQDLFFLRPFLERENGRSCHLGIGPVSAQRICHLLESVSGELAAQRDGFWPCRSRSFLLELLFFVGRLFDAPAADTDVLLPEQPADIEQVILYLHNHYREHITIADLTRLFHLNRTTLAEQFAGSTGMSVMAYLIALRMRLAALMLRDTELPIAEVMDRVGFNDPAHFRRTFRRHTGYAPQAYRERFCWMLGA